LDRSGGRRRPLEIAFEGSLRPEWVNGAGNGLDASRLEFAGGKSNELVCEEAAGVGTEGKCPVSLNVTGIVHTLGLFAQELMTVPPN
jgi:hypothetical protein